MNLPNKLTASRFVLTAIFMAAVFWRSPLNDTLALLLFSAASLTDYFDGKIARSRNLITNFGALMDPPDAEPTMESLSPLIRGVMRSIGRRLVVDKRVMADEAENDAEADLRLSTFLSQRLPLYRQLGIL